MKEKSSLGQSFDRLSSREKVLLVSFISVLLLVVGSIIWFSVSSSLSSLAEANQYRSKMLHKIRNGSRNYQKFRAEQLKEINIIKDNDIRHIQDELTKILRKSGIDVAQWRNPKREPLVKKKKKKRRATFRAKVEILERSFVITRVKFSKLFKFLEAIEQSKKLLLIKEIKIVKDANRDDEARRVNVTVATYRMLKER